MPTYCVDFTDSWGGYRHLTTAPSKAKAVAKAKAAYLGDESMPKGTTIVAAQADSRHPDEWVFTLVEEH